jgi:hypothetical protein
MLTIFSVLKLTRQKRAQVKKMKRWTNNTVGLGAIALLLWIFVYDTGLSGENVVSRQDFQPASASKTHPDDSSSHIRNNEAGFGSWFDGCQYVYLDVGTNVGVQIRKLYEPELYPGAKILSFFDELFEKDRKHLFSLCAVGFEPNIHHTSKLNALEAAYSAKGWRVKIFTETAVSMVDGNATFFFDRVARPEQHEWGASLIPWHKSMGTTSENDPEEDKIQTTVRTMDFAKYLLENVARRRINEMLNHSVLMKLDIEGSEHTILPHLIMTGSLCSINKIFLETHRWGAVKFPDGSSDGQFLSFFKQFVSSYNVTSCSTSILDVDDESYRDSDFPLPDSP